MRQSKALKEFTLEILRTQQFQFLPFKKQHRITDSECFWCAFTRGGRTCIVSNKKQTDKNFRIKVLQTCKQGTTGIFKLRHHTIKTTVKMSQYLEE